MAERLIMVGRRGEVKTSPWKIRGNELTLRVQGVGDEGDLWLVLLANDGTDKWVRVTSGAVELAPAGLHSMWLQGFCAEPTTATVESS